MKAKLVEFKPEQIIIDQIGDVPSGTMIELNVKFLVKPNGNWCMASIEGVPMPGFDGEGNPTGYKQEHMEKGRFVDSYKSAMGY